MNYTRPEIRLLQSAIAAVRSLDKEIGPFVETDRSYITISAYEADE